MESCRETSEKIFQMSLANDSPQLGNTHWLFMPLGGFALENWVPSRPALGRCQKQRGNPLLTLGTGEGSVV
jgi:hypothetical protein